MQTYLFLTNDNAGRQLVWRPAKFYFMTINTMLIAMNKLHYIWKYDRLKYGILVDSSLTATC